MRTNQIQRLIISRQIKTAAAGTSTARGLNRRI